jgi:2-polyprenyl-3-methyl-5-hydroxy-6-metoxy-1,4-benzoquinol methylase
MSKQKLLIGVPAYNGIVPEAMGSFLSMIYRCGRDMPDVDLAVKIVLKLQQFRARNQLVDAAIGAGFDWILMLDDDMVVPPDLVQRLLAHDKDVCGALYFQRGGSFHPVIMHRIVEENGTFAAKFVAHSSPLLKNPGLHQVDIAGGGCLLFKVDIFRKLMPPYFESERALGTDINLCSRLLDAGVDIFCDTSIELGHVQDTKQVVTSRTMPLAQRELAEVNEVLWEDAQDYLCMGPEELESRMLQASQREVRTAKWRERDRSTWEGVRAYYQDYGDWHTLNLLAHNMLNRERSKEWALLYSDAILKPGARVLDVGVGLGHVSIPLVQRYDYRVEAVEIAEAPTLDFLRYRMRKHGLGVAADRRKGISLTQIEDPVPLLMLLDGPVDGAFAISMIEHTWHPEGLLAWISQQVRPGGFLVCDYVVDKMDEEPQHLVKYDVSRFDQLMLSLGWVVSPEHDFLFLKR